MGRGSLDSARLCQGLACTGRDVDGHVTHNPTLEDIRMADHGPRLASYYNPHLDNQDPEKAWDFRDLKDDREEVRDVASDAREIIAKYDLDP